MKGSDNKEGDVLSSMFAASTHDHVLFFSNKGQVYWQKVYQLPEGSRTSKGRAIRNMLPLKSPPSAIASLVSWMRGASTKNP